MIEQLTEEQVEQLPLYRDRWLKIGLSTGPCDKEAVEAAVDESYRSGGYAPAPRKIWMGSLFAGMQEAYRQAQQGQQSIGAPIGAQVWAQIWEPIWAQVLAQIGEQAREQIWKHIFAPVLAQVRMNVRDQIEAQVRAQIMDLYYYCFHGTQNAYWLGFYEYLGEQCGLAQEIAPLQGLIRYAKAGGGWWWPFADVVVLSERPSKIIRDAEHRLHCEDGPAVLYPDGFAVYAKHGERYCIG